MTPEWLESLCSYLSMRHLTGELEEKCDGSCVDVENFYTCETCKDRRNWEYRMEALMKFWGDTWAVELSNRIEKEAERA